MKAWYPRLAAVPGIAYEGDPRAMAARLPGKGQRPEVEDGALYWKALDGSTSASPASDYRRTIADAEVEEVVPRTLEAMELPGRLIDYHFALQQCVQRLWQARKEAPSLLPDLEKIALLNIALVEAHSSVVRIGEPADGFVRIVAFGVLVNLYKREGAYHEALEIALRGEHMGQVCGADELQERIAALRAEEDL